MDIEVQQEICQAVLIAIEENNKNQHYNRCILGKITSVNSNGTYTVEINDDIDNIKPLKSADTYVVGDTCWILIINNDYKEKYILTKS